MTLSRWRVLSLVIFLVLACLSGAILPSLKYSFGIEAFFPDDDPEFQFYHGFKASFPSGGGGAFSVGIRDEKGIRDTGFVHRVRRVTRAISRVPGVENTYGLASLQEMLLTPLGVVKYPVLDDSDGEIDANEAEEAVKDPRFRWRLVSPDGKSVQILGTLEKPLGFEEEVWFSDTLRTIVTAGGVPEATLVGLPITNATLGKLQRRELLFFSGAVACVILVVMFLAYRAFWGVVLGFSSVILATLLFFGLFVGLGQELDLLGTLFPVLMLIVGTSDVVHILSKYVFELRAGHSQSTALRVTVRDIGLATFMTCFSTAVGFATLFTSGIPAIGAFGWWAAVGVMMAFATVMLFTVPLMTLWGPDSLMRQTAPGGRSLLDRVVMGGYYWGKRRGGVILLISLMAAGLGIWGMFRIPWNLHDLRDFPSGERMTADYARHDTTFKGVGGMEWAMVAQEGRNFWEPELMRKAGELEDYLGSQPEVGEVMGPATGIRLGNRMREGRGNLGWRFPETEEGWTSTLDFVRKQLGGIMGGLISTRGDYARITAKVPDLGTLKLAELKNRVEDWVGGHVPGNLFSVRPTGPRHLVDVNQDRLVNNLLQSIGWSTLILGAVIGMLYWNWGYIWVFLIPNLFPLVLGLGLIGWLGIEMDPKVAIVFSIAFGIAVDDTIHFLAKLRIEQRKGKTLEESLEATFQDTGKALVLTTLFLLAGFGTLLFSAFPPSYLIGLILCFTLIFALVAELFLTPLCVRYLIRDINQKK